MSERSKRILLSALSVKNLNENINKRPRLSEIEKVSTFFEGYFYLT